jgi:hypothetical protein
VFFEHPSATVTIGNYCSIAGGVVYYGAAHHRMDCVSTFPFKEKFGWDLPTLAHTKGALVIEHDVWIANGVQILNAVRIGTGAVIGAHTVVTKDVPPYAVMCGNPGVVKKFRFPEDTIARLLASKWWERTPQQLQPFANMLNTSGQSVVEAFLDLLADNDDAKVSGVSDDGGAVRL